MKHSTGTYIFTGNYVGFKPYLNWFRQTNLHHVWSKFLKSLRLWNLADGKEITVLNGHTKSVNSVAFSPDGKLLVSGAHDNTIRLWNVESDSLIRELKDNRGPVLSVAFSSDGTRLASGSESGIVNLWGIPAE